MIKPSTTKPLAVLSLATLSFAFLGSFGFLNEAKAICTNKCQTGLNACSTWCLEHNKTGASILKCNEKCGDYWNSGRNPQSIGRPGPPNPSGPPRKVDPGKLKKPPTTVSNPNAPTQSPVQIRTRQKK